MRNTKTAVIADDDKETLRDLIGILESENFNVTLALDTVHAIELIKQHQPNLVISEVADNNYDGISIFKYLNEDLVLKNQIPKLIALTANEEESNEILCYQSGIDFYLQKPLRKDAFKKRLFKCFGEQKTTYQLKALTEYKVRDLKFDVTKQRLFRLPDEESLNIQSKSFDILLLLARSPNKVFSRQEILEASWGNSTSANIRTVDIHVLKIRQAIGDGYIKTIKGVGYRFLTAEEVL